jgi:hypothetical protein
VGALYVMCVCAAAITLARSGGASAQPTRHPVSEKSLPPLLIVHVRSRIPGTSASRACAAPAPKTEFS